jgi:hypothetical protein
MASVSVCVAHLVVDAGFAGAAGGRGLLRGDHVQVSARAAHG